MRLLHLCMDPGVALRGRAGSSVHLRELIAAFVEEGHRVHFAGTVRDRRPGPEVPASLHDGDCTNCAGRTGAALAGELDRVAALLRPELVYERYALGRDEGQALAVRHGVPHVLEVNAPLVWEAARYRGATARPDELWTEHRIWREASLVVVPSAPLADRVRRAGQANVRVVPNAAAARPRVDPAEGRRALGLGHRFVVGHVGSMKAWHDLPTVVRAVGDLPSTLRPVLLLVGEGPELGRAHRLAGALGVDVVSPGFVAPDDLGTYLAATDVAVASVAADPGLDYFSPLKVADYLRAGLPVVAAATGDVVDLGRRGALLLYRPGDAAELSAQLGELARDPARRAELGAHGQRLALDRTWRVAARRTLADVLTQGRRGAPVGLDKPVGPRGASSRLRAGGHGGRRDAMKHSEGPSGVVVHTLQSASDAGLQPEYKGRPTPPDRSEGNQEIYSLGARSILEATIREIPAETLANLRGFQIIVLA